MPDSPGKASAHSNLIKHSRGISRFDARSPVKAGRAPTGGRKGAGNPPRTLSGRLKVSKRCPVMMYSMVDGVWESSAA